MKDRYEELMLSDGPLSLALPFIGAYIKAGLILEIISKLHYIHIESEYSYLLALPSKIDVVSMRMYACVCCLN